MQKRKRRKQEDQDLGLATGQHQNYLNGKGKDL